ncbi:MAG: NADH-quinone oxidoreductase subunit NuoK [Clostridia bacterium]|nr:NADH-quinone oxidoreductase subunit NuoK [Clostridia bacterium]
MPVGPYIVLSAVLFALGLAGFLARRNPLTMLMCVELMWNAANLAFVAFARQSGDPAGHVFTFLVITVAAAEVAIGLAIVVLLFRQREAVDIDEIHLLKG